MKFQGEFETFKMIEQGGRVYSGTDDSKGELLIYLIQKGTVIHKEQFIRWLQELCTQLDAYHRCRHMAYQYLNPYTIVITNENSIRLLDLEAQGNESVLVYIQRNVIRDSFGKKSSIRRRKIHTDFYSIGKTLQFLIAQGNINPKINIFESYIFLKIIRKCLEDTLEYQYKNIKEIQNQIPKSKQFI